MEMPYYPSKIIKFDVIDVCSVALVKFDRFLNDNK